MFSLNFAFYTRAIVGPKSYVILGLLCHCTLLKSQGGFSFPQNRKMQLKGQVYLSPPRDINDLRARIVAAVETLRGQREVIRDAMRAMRTRAEVCVQRNGGHVEGHWG